MAYGWVIVLVRSLAARVTGKQTERMAMIIEVDPPPGNSDFPWIIVIELELFYILIIPLFWGGGPPNLYPLIWC